MIVKRLIFLFVVLLLMIGIINVNSSSENEKIPVIVKLNSEKKTGFGFFKSSEARAIQEIENKDVRKYKNMIAMEVTKKEFEDLKENPYVKDISFTHKFKASLQDSVPLVNSTISWPVQLNNFNITGIDETVCVIDSGINFTHPDLIGKNKTCVIDCFNKTCVENCSIGDDEGHGTHVGGTVAANGVIKGVAINASLIALKVLNSTGDAHYVSGTLDITNAIDWCVDNADTYNISVITMSLGTITLFTNYCDASFPSITTAINNATKYNISVTSSTGNDRSTTQIASPACIENASAIGSIMKDDSTFDFNRNAITDFIAPGDNINSTKATGGYEIMSGTSMSTPHVAGAFALIRSFLKLQNNKPPSVSEVQDALNSSSKIIYDSGSGLNYSRIDIFSTLISIDSSNPAVTLSSPVDSTSQFLQNMTFNCYANDVQLDNLTLYVWNSSSIYNTTFRNVDGSNANESFNLIDIESGNYEWSCLAYDENGNFSFASSNYSFTIEDINVTLNSPSNNTYTTQNQIYNCSVNTSPANLTNITFYIWNSSGLIYNFTETVTGSSNSTISNYNFSNQGSYSWNCKAYNNNSQFSFADSNYTITYDTVDPIISSVENDSIDDDSAVITWTTNENANSSVNYGTNTSLGNKEDSGGLRTSHSETLSGLDDGTKYYYNVTSCDVTGNCDSSSIYEFTTNESSSSTTSSGGGGGGGPTITTTTYKPSDDQVLKGYHKELKEDDKIKFKLIDKEEHTLTVEEISVSSVEILIQSNTAILNLRVGDNKKVNLTSGDFYDFYVKLNAINDEKANLTIKAINEEIPEEDKQKLRPESVINQTSTNETIGGSTAEKPSRISFIFYAVIAIVLIAFIVLVVIEIKSRISKKKTNKKK